MALHRIPSLNLNVQSLSQANAQGWRSIDCPAKINLMLSVHNKREDGFHDLSSLVVPLQFGDRLALRPSQATIDTLECDQPGVPTDERNLVLRAAALFRQAARKQTRFVFRLEKRIPVAAGLGGGSSNGSAALVALNEWFQRPLRVDQLMTLAAKLGSDCPFFIEGAPAVVRGRGEHVEVLSPDLRSRLSGQKLVLAFPSFSVATAWAYGQLVAQSHYEPVALAQSRLDRFYGGESVESLLFNSFEAPVGAKHLAISTFLETLRAEGANCLMSGSGSACFILLPGGIEGARFLKRCRACWGEEIFCVETSIT